MMSCNDCKNRNTWICNCCVGWNRYDPIIPAFNPKVNIDKEMKMLAKVALNNMFGAKNTERKNDMKIKKVYFNEPATVVLWEDGTKTIVKAGEGDIYDPEKGLAMAIAKKALGNQGNYYEVFKKWLPEEECVDDDYDYQLEQMKEYIDELDKELHKKHPTVMLTPEELAEKLGCTKATIQKQCREGLYPGAEKIGGKWKIPYTE